MKNWKSDAAWKLVDHLVTLRQTGKRTQREKWTLRRAIKASLKADRTHGAANVTSEMKGHLAAGDPNEAWESLQGCCCAVEDPAKPCYDSMGKQTAKRGELYKTVSTPWDHIPINVNAFQVTDKCPGCC